MDLSRGWGTLIRVVRRKRGLKPPFPCQVAFHFLAICIGEGCGIQEDLTDRPNPKLGGCIGLVANTVFGDGKGSHGSPRRARGSVFPEGSGRPIVSTHRLERRVCRNCACANRCIGRAIGGDGRTAFLVEESNQYVLPSVISPVTCQTHEALVHSGVGLRTSRLGHSKCCYVASRDRHGSPKILVRGENDRLNSIDAVGCLYRRVITRRVVDLAGFVPPLDYVASGTKGHGRRIGGVEP